MKRKILLVASFVVITINLTACSFFAKFDEEMGFLYEFGLEDYYDIITMTKIHDSRGGMTYDGIYAYEVTIIECPELLFDEWDSIPYNDKVMDFLEFISSTFTIPEIEKGKYKLIDYTEDKYPYITKASLFVYDEENEIGYCLNYRL